MVDYGWQDAWVQYIFSSMFLHCLLNLRLRNCTSSKNGWGNSPLWCLACSRLSVVVDEWKNDASKRENEGDLNVVLPRFFSHSPSFFFETKNEGLGLLSFFLLLALFFPQECPIYYREPGIDFVTFCWLHQFSTECPKTKKGEITPDNRRGCTQTISNELV